MDLSARRTAQPYLDALVARALPQRVAPGASSYFSAPEEQLDPALFAGDSMHPKVRSWLRQTLHAFLERKGYRGSTTWAHIWLAGSGASYQWSAARDPGDLDILIGVDYESFRQQNPRYGGLSDVEISDDLNQTMSSELWPTTANQALNGHTYEVTWYVNPHSTDIRSINPYAAYDVDRSEWTVRPIELPKDGPGSWFPKVFDHQAKADQQQALGIVARYNQAREVLGRASSVGTRTNAATQLGQATKDAESLFSEIHLGRHAAFDTGGEGYRDFANYRWQRGKQLGTVPALRAIHDEAKAAREESEVALYGRKLKSTEQTRIDAALRRTT